MALTEAMDLLSSREVRAPTVVEGCLSHAHPHPSRPPMASPCTLAEGTRRAAQQALPTVVRQEATGAVSEDVVKPYVEAAVAFVVNHLAHAEMYAEEYGDPAVVNATLVAYGVQLALRTVKRHHDDVVVGTTVREYPVSTKCYPVCIACN
jgi:hypothetical protein